MAYEIIDWKNKGETGAKPINRDNLRHMDNGILNLDTYKAEIMPLLTVSDTAPVECERGDLYYNTTTELIYVATQPDTWSEEGTTPSIFNLYVDLSSSKLYYYDGTNFNSYGSGGGGETLPVGTELDFDGASQDIPTGWEQVNNKEKILWTNEYPTQAMTQTNITLSSSDYDILEIFFVHKAGNNFSTYSIRMLKNSVGTRCFIPSVDGIVYRVITKNTDTSITVNSVTNSVDNSLAVPLYIIGYKTGLFN